MWYFFFFNDTATTEIYTLSLHDALPICIGDELRKDPPDHRQRQAGHGHLHMAHLGHGHQQAADRKSTRLNSSHLVISYAVFCLKKKNRSGAFHGLTHGGPADSVPCTRPS